MQDTQIITENDSCEGCPAPCCRTQQIPHTKPEYQAWVDWTRYFLLFPGTELVITAEGNYYFIRWQECSMFLADKCACSVHNTSKQPDICKSFSARNCWYKRNFVTEEPADICRLNLERYERWTEQFIINRNTQIEQFPDLEATRKLVRDIPISPILKMNNNLIKEHNT